MHVYTGKFVKLVRWALIRTPAVMCMSVMSHIRHWPVNMVLASLRAIAGSSNSA